MKNPLVVSAAYSANAQSHNQPLSNVQITWKRLHYLIIDFRRIYTNKLFTKKIAAEIIMAVFSVTKWTWNHEKLGADLLSPERIISFQRNQNISKLQDAQEIV